MFPQNIHNKNTQELYENDTQEARWTSPLTHPENWVNSEGILFARKKPGGRHWDLVFHAAPSFFPEGNNDLQDFIAGQFILGSPALLLMAY